MTDRLREARTALREALAAGPTPGPWYTVDPPWGKGDFIVAGNPDPHIGKYVADTENFDGRDDDRALEDAAYIAACSPDRIALLLDALDAAERRQAEPVAWRPALTYEGYKENAKWHSGRPDAATIDYWREQDAGIEYAYAPVADQPQQAAERQSAVYLVATGHAPDGRELYERHDVRPALCDAETLYAAPVATPADQKLWLWKNFVGGRPEYWAFDNPFPIRLDCGAPPTLGEPCGYALFKPSRAGRTDVPEEEVLRRIKVATPADQRRDEERDAWRSVERDGMPPCNGETVYLGENEAGYLCTFTWVNPDGLCVQGSPEAVTAQFSVLKWWRVADRPNRAAMSTKKGE